MGLNPAFNASSPSAGLARPKMAKGGIVLRCFQSFLAHWRAIVVLLILAFAAYSVIALPDLNLASFVMVLYALLLIFIASQIFWIRRAVDLGQWLFPAVLRVRLVIIADLAYLLVFVYSFPTTIGQGHTFRSAFYRLPNIAFEGLFWWWFVGSMLAFVLVIAFRTVDRVTGAAVWMYRQASQVMQWRAADSDSAVAGPVSLGRRRFLEQTAVLVSATPFVAAGYGLLYERLDVEVVRQPIRLARLPKAFDGFRIAQLSDIHLGPFTSADYIRHCVAITNGLKPDLVALTGDYIAWDPERQAEVVGALAGLRAPCGVFGCLGNHEMEGQFEDSITRLFAAHGIRILRGERVPIRLGADMLNLIGIDEPHGRAEGDGAEWRQDFRRKVQQTKELMLPETVNILLSHGDAPHMFDGVAEVGIDLMLAGHTHGGQLSLDFLHPGLNLGRLIYDYNSGWYEKNGAQLYVNRGIGTTGFPIRLGARPEISILELTRI